MTKRKNILVTGGAGYIGSHIVLALRENGYVPVILDDLSSGHAELAGDEIFVQGDIADTACVSEILKTHDICSVIHMAALVSVPESVECPARYFETNVHKMKTFLETCKARDVENVLFSSSAAVYGQPEMTIIDENTPENPINPYGETKLEGEKLVRESGLRHVNLRYFNVAGCDSKGRTGQMNKTQSLVRMIAETAIGQHEKFQIFGTDYDTPDGTAVRDYIHVSDLATAHIAALEYLQEGKDSVTLNCGYGRGYSVREVVDTAQEVLGIDLNVIEAPRRAGDPAALIANVDQMKAYLNWTPKHDDLKKMIISSYNWMKRLQNTPLSEMRRAS